MSANGAPKTCGTHSLWDAVTHPETIATVLRREPTRDPAADLASLERGAPLRTSAARKAGWRWRQGHLFFRSADDPAPIAWYPGIWYWAWRAAEPLNGPIIVEAVEEITGADRFWITQHLFKRITLTAAGQPWIIAVPTHDLPLVLAAFEAHNKR